MQTRTCLLIRWVLLASIPLMGSSCGGQESVHFTGSDGSPDGTTGKGGSATGGGGGGNAGSSGAAGTAGTGGTTGGSGGGGGISGASGAGGTAGKGGASGAGGTAGKGGASGTGGTAGKGGASGTGGTAGSSGASGAGGAAGASGAGGTAGSSGASGAGGTAGASGASGASGAGGTAGNAGSSGAAGTAIDAGKDVNTTDRGSDGDVATDATGDAGCPDVFGTYEINNANGSCGDLDEDAPQEIRGTTQACALHFISVVDGGPPAVNGGATLGPDGTFSGATLILGTMTRSPCSGTWDANQQELTVVCGSGGNECLVELRWEGP